jgi:methyl-accepting chemotaxis protein
MIVGAIGVFALRSTAAKYHHIASTNLPNAMLLGRMQFEADEVTRHYLRLMIPDAGKESYQKSLQEMEQSIASYEKADKTYSEVPFVEGEQALYDAQNGHWKAFLALAREAASAYQSADLAKQARFLEIIRTDIAKVKNAHITALDQLIEFQEAEAKKWVDDAQTTAATASLVAISMVVGGFLLAVLVGVLFARSLTNALRSVTQQISSSSTQVSTASEQLSSASQTLSSGATEAASSLAETVASVEELSSMVKLNADNAREAATLSQSSRQSAEEGEAEIRKLNDAMGEISQSSKKIEEIINVIDDIAFQTNLLALNAAVEAARAGEQGKGFAVVAEAVRNLAQRSASAAKDITTLIQDSVGKIERGTKVADEGARSLKAIVGTVKKVADLNNEIASASQEQANGLAQISKAMTELDQATQRNAASAEETAAASEEMSSQAILLQDMVTTLGMVVEGRNKGAAELTAEGRQDPSFSRSAANVRSLATARPTQRVRPRPASASSHVSAATPGSASREEPRAENIIPFQGEEPVRKVGTTNGF